MTDINTENDRVEVYPREDGRFGWRRTDGTNGDIVATDGGQGYESEAYARAAAEAYNPGIPLVNLVPEGEAIDGP